MEKLSPILQKISKNAKIIAFGSSETEDYDPLKDLIGIVKAKKPLNIEELIDLRGFEDAGDHLEL